MSREINYEFAFGMLVDGAIDDELGRIIAAAGAETDIEAMTSGEIEFDQNEFGSVEFKTKATIRRIGDEASSMTVIVKGVAEWRVEVMSVVSELTWMPIDEGNIVDELENTIKLFG